ncbi:MAG TPA: hypothetical protein VKY45_09085, partial [Marinilabiliaceae bacterium]|nr:hypothetical protein [Marinilabiliaceae bacterium]
MINIIRTNHINTGMAWQIVHEWEEDFSKITKSSTAAKTFEKNNLERIMYNEKIFGAFQKLGKNNNINITFHMVPPFEFNWSSWPSFVPIIIDCWPATLDRIKKFCKYNSKVFLASKQAVGALSKNGTQNIEYAPVSISDRYKLNEYPIKEIDLLSYGRNHTSVQKWTDKLFADKKVHIVKCFKNSQNGRVVAHSNQRGIIGTVENRRELISLIKLSRHVTASSPGVDPKDEFDYKRTGGFAPVTPRFLEAAACYAKGVGIFPSNEDYRFCNIKQVANNVSNFDEFKTIINSGYSTRIRKLTFDDFLSQHWSNVRYKQ